MYRARCKRTSWRLFRQGPLHQATIERHSLRLARTALIEYSYTDIGDLFEHVVLASPRQRASHKKLRNV